MDEVGHTIRIANSIFPVNNGLYTITSVAPAFGTGSVDWNIGIAENLSFVTASADDVDVFFDMQNTCLATIGYDGGIGNDENDIVLMYKNPAMQTWKYVYGINQGETVSLDAYSIEDDPQIQFRLKYKKSVSSVYTENILGTNDIYMNFVVNGTEGINTLPATTTPFVVNLNGFAESIGSPLTGVQWSVISGPSGAVNTFSAPTNTVTNFVTDLFGSYVIALTATNANGQTAVDMLTLNLIEQVNQPPVAVAKWGDGTQAPKNITWQVVQPITAIWYGLYQAQLSSASSSDDGYIVGQYWQYNLNNAGWTDLTSNAPLFPSAVSPAQSINTDGNWKFRVKVKDNFGLTSNWSNDLILDITGSQMGGNPLYLFQMQICGGR